MVFTLFASFTALLCTSYGFVDARIVPRDVVSPHITYPAAGTLWNVNGRHNVTWDTSAIPSGDNNTGMVVLGFLEANDTDEHLDLKNPLAKGFLLTAGRVNITVPSVPSGDNYIIVLFGDSGNASPEFTISNISISASSTTTTGSSSPSSSSASITPAQQSAPSGGSSIVSMSQAPSSTAIQEVSGSTAAASAIVTSASALTPSSASSPASTAQAQSATSSNAGVRNTSYGGTATWISTICSLAILLGLSL